MEYKILQLIQGNKDTGIGFSEIYEQLSSRRNKPSKIDVETVINTFINQDKIAVVDNSLYFSISTEEKSPSSIATSSLSPLAKKKGKDKGKKKLNLSQNIALFSKGRFKLSNLSVYNYHSSLIETETLDETEELPSISEPTNLEDHIRCFKDSHDIRLLNAY
jgi:hypothetical protein